MTEDTNVDDGQRYLRRRTSIFDVVNYLLEQADAITDDVNIAEQDREELRAGVLMLSEGVQNFFECSEALMLEAESIAPALLHLTSCLYAVLGGSALTFRHVDLSESKKKEIRRKSTEAGSSARTAAKQREAEKVRDIIERADKDEDGKLVNPGSVRGYILRALGRDKLDYKTLASWVDYIESTRRIDGPPDEK